VSVNVADPASLNTQEEAPAAAPTNGRRSRPLVAVLAWAVATGVALTVHHLLPNQQELEKSWMDDLPAWKHPYPVLLEAGLALAVITAVVQQTWPTSRAWVGHYAPLFTGGAALLCVWDLLTLKLAVLPLPYFPGPDEVFGGMIDDRWLLLVSALHSLRLLFCGYFGGVVMGLVTGVCIGWFPRVRYWGMPILKFLGPVPATALVPLVMILPVRDFLFLSGAALIAFAVWFPVTMLTSSGISNVRLSYLDVARTLGAGRLYLIFRVAIPSALPNIFVGLFMGLGASFLTLIAAETLGVKAGVGWYIGMQKGAADYAKVYASLLIMAAFFSTLMSLLFKLRDRVLKWQKGVIKW